MRRHSIAVLLEADELGAHLHLVVTDGIREEPVEDRSDDALRQLVALRQGHAAEVLSLGIPVVQALDRRGQLRQLVEHVEVLERPRDVDAEG